MNDQQLLRYSRHILLDQIGIEGQQKINQAHALIIGAGGLGSPVALYLASAGVGHITIVDDDVVDLTNLQRQILHSTASVGMAKTASAVSRLHALNPEIQIHTVQERAQAQVLHALLPRVDIVIDCSDNFQTRHAINHACMHFGTPLVSGAAIQFDGQVSAFVPGDPHSPCYACLFPMEQQPEDVLCSSLGVFAPLLGIIGSIQAAEALKMVLGIGTNLVGRLLIFDAQNMTSSEIKIQRDEECAVCRLRQSQRFS
jgi:molybdopterin/thiamine biosynthesis adenylyltransferase